MFERLMTEKNFNNLANDEIATPLEPESPDYAELQFLFNTIFNETSGRISSNEISIYEIEKAYSLKNQYISLNFSKRAKNEITSYGWFDTKNYDDKRLDEQVIRYKTKGPEEITDEIKVSSPVSKEGDRYIIILCKFIVGKSELIFQDQELSKDEREIYKKDFDTVVRVLSNSNNKDNYRNYNILREENIELLYLVRVKKGEFQTQLIECSNPLCPNNELNNENTNNKREQKEDKNMYYCLLKENYFCNQCHIDTHQKEILLGAFDVSRCELRTWPNLPGECPNKEFHPNKKSFDIEYFCRDCLKGICSYCKVYGNEKHSDLRILTDLFSKSKSKENFNSTIQTLNRKITEKQNENKNIGGGLRTFLKKHAIKLHEILDNKFTEEGEKLVSICYQLNFLKDNLIFYHNAYNNKEKLCFTNNLKQELFWTKKTHFDHLLYLIGIKDNIETDYKVNMKEFHRIIDKFNEEIDKKINQDFGFKKHVEIKKEKKQSIITYENLFEQNIITKNDEFNYK
jgi:hypothetical protein